MSPVAERVTAPFESGSAPSRRVPVTIPRRSRSPPRLQRDRPREGGEAALPGRAFTPRSTGRRSSGPSRPGSAHPRTLTLPSAVMANSPMEARPRPAKATPAPCAETAIRTRSPRARHGRDVDEDLVGLAGPAPWSGRQGRRVLLAGTVPSRVTSWLPASRAMSRVRAGRAVDHGPVDLEPPRDELQGGHGPGEAAGPDRDVAASAAQDDVAVGRGGHRPRRSATPPALTTLPPSMAMPLGWRRSHGRGSPAPRATGPDRASGPGHAVGQWC